MVQIIKPKATPIIGDKGKTGQDSIPKDPEGIKEYLKVIPLSTCCQNKRRPSFSRFNERNYTNDNCCWCSN
jgi:hypothetical protein